MALNNVILMGRITKDPELSVTNGGKEYLRFCVAVDRNYSGKDSEKKTDFINCVAWNKTAVFIETYFKKGSMIAIQGHIETSSYKDKDGNQRNSTDVVVEQTSFCGSKNSTESAPAPAVQPTTAAASLDINVDDDDDSLPF